MFNTVELEILRRGGGFGNGVEQSTPPPPPPKLQKNDVRMSFGRDS